ncbi:MAG: helix-turn-helix transcriptional regulator [Candidatus Nanopelagicales bacterium]|nr:helix-turn-helix transcriptional regulator [Candidatus Nanopelagicales bacterium]MDZ4250089.1 helix-turn-helix transcriptional regulator [Candidatus Nanopelagicales bacterium]
MNRPARDSTGGVDALIGAKLRAMRGERGVTQSSIADTMRAFDHNWAPATVAGVETGRRNLSLGELADLCRILNVTVQTFVSDSATADTDTRARAEALVYRRPTEAPPERVAASDRARRLERLEHIVLESALGPDDPGGEEADRDLLAIISAHYGRDLLAERDQRARATSTSKAWATRAIIDELANMPELRDAAQAWSDFRYERAVEDHQAWQGQRAEDLAREIGEVE